MNEAETLATVDVLLALGFEPVSDPLPRLSSDFGNCQLRAGEVTNLYGKVVMFGGVLATPRTIAEVDFTIPTRVASREQCVAMIAYYLDRSAHGKIFKPTNPVCWLDEGRLNKDLLPWEVERAKRVLEEAPYRARPRCLVLREWARLAFRTLRFYLDPESPDAVGDEIPVVFLFKNSILTIRCNSELVAMAGRGEDWPQKFAVGAEHLRQPPKPFRGGIVEVSFWDGELRINDQFYPVIEDALP
jgi:hypothetical protein